MKDHCNKLKRFTDKRPCVGYKVFFSASSPMDDIRYIRVLSTEFFGKTSVAVKKRC